MYSKNSSGSYTYESYINNGHGWTMDHSWDLPVILNTNGSETNYRFVDVNGDGLTDIMYSSLESGSHTYTSSINNGHGWTTDNSWDLPVDLDVNGSLFNYRFVDVNGDGLTDIMYSTTRRSSYLYESYINNGHGWTMDHSWDLPVILNTNG